VGGVVIHDDAPVECEECIMNDAAPTEFADRLVMMTTVSNANIMTPTARNGGCMSLMTLTAPTISRRNVSPLVGMPSHRPRSPRAPSSPRRRRIESASFPG
jgi:hypothetical protein